MNQTRLCIAGPDGAHQVVLHPDGMVLGRAMDCDIVLDHPNVSRRHACIFRDAFGGWVVQDMRSQNGVWVEGQSIDIQSLTPGQSFQIRPFIMTLMGASQGIGRPAASPERTLAVIDSASDHSVVSYRGYQRALSSALVQHLNDLADRLTKPSDLMALYHEACQGLSPKLKAMVTVVRLPQNQQPLPESPEVLACHFPQETALQGFGPCAHLSRRVLEAVRTTDVPVMAGAGRKMDLTITDAQAPHVVFAAQVREAGSSLDAIYIDMPEPLASEGVFDFVEGDARNINFAQKNILLTEVQRQQEALQEANEHLRQKDRIKDEYVSRVTHDIKGHLAAIQSCLAVVAMAGSAGSLTEKQSEFLVRAQNRTVDVANFVRELLDLTQMRLSGKTDMASFPLPAVLRTSLESIAPNARDKSISVTSDIHADIGEIVGNEFSITEMVSNLLFNAVKYSPSGASVHLAAQPLGDYVQIKVSDTGMGIPPEDLSHIFEEFFRATNAKRNERDGTGLGLSIVKQIVDLHGGRIDVESQLDKGTTFTTVLPIHPAV